MKEPKAEKADRIETPKVEMVKKVEMAPPVPLPADAPKEEGEKSISDADVAKKQAKVKSTKDYINYYQLLREKIRRRLKANYSDDLLEGEVVLNFTLDARGALLSCSADRANSVKDETLVRVAEKSLRDASPFSPFPKGLDIPRMSFSVAVSFKKNKIL
jgi:TonB family protein